MDNYGGHVIMWMIGIGATFAAGGILVGSVYMLFTVLWLVPIVVWSFMAVACIGAWFTRPAPEPKPEYAPLPPMPPMDGAEIRMRLKSALEFCYHCGDGLTDDDTAPFCLDSAACHNNNGEGPPSLLDHLCKELGIEGE